MVVGPDDADDAAVEAAGGTAAMCFWLRSAAEAGSVLPAGSVCRCLATRAAAAASGSDVHAGACV